MKDDIIREAALRLRTINRKTGDRFAEVCAGLGHLSPEQLSQFAEDAIAIADSGWRSFEPLNLLLDLGERLNAERLIRVAACSRQISGYSCEPALAYLRLVHSHPSMELDRVEHPGLALHKSYQHASTLLAGYFRSAAGILDHCGISDQAAWFSLVRRFSQEGRDGLQELIRLTPECRRWQTALVLAKANTANCLAYLRQSAALEQMFAGRLDAVDQVIASCVDCDVPDTLLAALLAIARFPAPGQNLLLSLSLKLPGSEAVIALLEGAVELPLDRPEVVSDWLHYGLGEAAGNNASLVAYLRLESLRSREVLKQFRGEVSLADHQRTFDLLVEALSARELMIDTIPDEPPGVASDFRREHPVAPGVDARTIYLPGSISLFDNSEDNFAFYKVSIFHQIGFVEFGCFSGINDVLLQLESYRDERLAQALFRIVEDARIDWQLETRYPGLVPQLRRLKGLALADRKPPLTRRVRLLEVLVRTGLDGEMPGEADPEWQEVEERLRLLMLGLSVPGASLDDTLIVVSACYELIATEAHSLTGMSKQSEQEVAATLAEFPEPVSFRGEIKVAEVARSLRIEALIEEALQEEGEVLPDAPGVPMPGSPDEQIEPGDLQPGEVSEGVSMQIAELQRELEQAGVTPESGDGGGVEFPGGISAHSRETRRHRYDEWDYLIADYRGQWCTLYEYRDLDEDHTYFRRSLADNRDLARRIRHQLNRVRPEMLRKVKGVIEGEELDLERSVSYLVDRRAGLTPDETIYVQRQRRERDVSTLFLLDMSASTDDIVPDPDATPPTPDIDDDDEYLMQYFERQRAFEADARRIIDLEKESVILMADALESLGDAYSVCGFSGYGRDQVDYYICKDFDESFDARAQGRIGGIKPCRSTRMGAPVRHATRRLMETGSRIKALIIISDGYPQDHDYGADRNSREYGLNDTMKALSEAKQQGVLSYCLTVDPSGHDYLRAMCPDSQYMVIQDLNQLPEELARVYRSLTG